RALLIPGLCHSGNRGRPGVTSVPLPQWVLMTSGSSRHPARTSSCEALLVVRSASLRPLAPASRLPLLLTPQDQRVATRHPFIFALPLASCLSHPARRGISRTSRTQQTCRQFLT